MFNALLNPKHPAAFRFVGPLLLAFLPWLAFSADASECPIEAETEFTPGVWIQLLEGGIEIPIPEGMRITQFHSTTDPSSGQEYDEITFSSGSDTPGNFFIFLRTLGAYEEAKGFSWSDLLGEGRPTTTGVCTLAGEEFSYREHEEPFSQMAIYSQDKFLLYIYADDALAQITTMISNAKRYWR